MDGDFEDIPASAGAGSGSDSFGDFVEEFMSTVSVKTIMGTSRSICRPEARLMLAQFRGCHLEFITLDDPGVLMLDGLPLSELESFLLSGGADLELLIRGHVYMTTDGFLSTGDPRNTTSNSINNTGSSKKQKRSTLIQLNTKLNLFKQAQNDADKDYGRQQFFYCYENLDVVQMMQIPTNIRKQIEDALELGVSYQETMLSAVDLSFINDMSNGNEEEGPNDLADNGYVSRLGLMTNTGYYGEVIRSTRKGSTTTDQRKGVLQTRKRVASIESKNIMQWIKENFGSQHTWFFFAGCFLFVAFFIQIWVDYAFGEIWRALLMQVLSLASILICLMEADTAFIRSTIQEKLYNSYGFLQSIEGRTIFYAFICFLAFGKFTSYDGLAIFGGFVMLSLTLTRFILFKLSDILLDDMIYPLQNSSMIRKKFRTLDTNEDGYLMLDDMKDIVADSNFKTRWLKEVIFWRLDSATNDGQIDMYEFVQFCSKFRENVTMLSARKKERQYQKSAFHNPETKYVT